MARALPQGDFKEIVVIICDYRFNATLGPQRSSLDKLGNRTERGVAVAELAGRVLKSDLNYFADVLLEEAVVFIGKNYDPEDPVYIAIIEAGAILGITNLDTAFINGYDGPINLDLIKWFACGAIDGLSVAKGDYKSYPNFNQKDQLSWNF